MKLTGTCVGFAALVLAAALLPQAALADITVGVTIPATGNAAALGVPGKKAFTELWPKEIAGEKINLILLDDASDPGQATTNARRLVTEDKVDVLIGSSITPSSVAVSGVALENGVPHFTQSPVGLPPGRDKWTFVMPQKVSLMAQAVFEHMKANNVKTVGYIGFSDSWGDLWVTEFKNLAVPMGFTMVAEERYARADTSVAGQALKLVAAKPDVVLVGASGTGAALPQNRAARARFHRHDLSHARRRHEGLHPHFRQGVRGRGAAVGTAGCRRAAAAEPAAGRRPRPSQGL